MAEKKRKIYWDSSVFLAWLKDEKRPDNEMDGVYACVQDVEERKILLVTSSETINLEVLDAKMTNRERAKLNALFERRNLQLLPYELRVQGLVKSIREYYAREQERTGRKMVTSEDAKHLASAIHYRVEAFYTFDGGKRAGRSLLGLNGSVAGHPLTICKPPVGQMRLDLGQETNSGSKEGTS